MLNNQTFLPQTDQVYPIVEGEKRSKVINFTYIRSPVIGHALSTTAENNSRQNTHVSPNKVQALCKS